MSRSDHCLAFQLLDHQVRACLGLLANVNPDCSLGLAGFLQGCELAFEQGWRHEMGAGLHALTNKRWRPFQIDEVDVLTIADKDLAVANLERRAGDHQRYLGRDGGVDLFGDAP